MKIVYTDFLNDPEKPGESGTSNTVWGMAEAARNLGHDVMIVAPYTSSTLPISDIPVMRFKAPVILYRNVISQFILALIGAFHVQRLKNVDVVHCRDQISATALLMSRVRRRVVFTSPGNIFMMLSTTNSHDKIATWFFCRFQKFIAKHCPVIVATSEELTDWWIYTGADRESLRTIPLGVDSRVFHRLQNARHHLSWEHDRHHLLYVGRLSAEKGIPDLLLAIEPLEKKGIPLKLHIVGDGPLRGALTREVASRGLHNVVEFHGWLDRQQLALFYSAADACILPSHNEPFGRVLMESMACGCLFIGSNHGATRDHIIHGENGFIFEHGDHEALSELIQHITTVDFQTLESIRESALQKVKSSFSWESVVIQLCNTVYATISSREYQ